MGRGNATHRSARARRRSGLIDNHMHLDRVSLEGIAAVFNLFNSPNWTITTVETSPQYLQRTSGQNRTAQVGFRVTY
jgi:hypothetical protein